MQLIKMISGTESEVEVDEAEGEASGSCSTSTTSGVGREKRRSKVWLYFQKIKNLDGSACGDCVECTECGKTIKTKTGNTTNLMMTFIPLVHCSIHDLRKYPLVLLTQF